jgi:acyl-CoA synthetase (AMP-forming)/AMP-acid ligase II
VFACVVSEGATPDAAARQQIAADIVAWCLSRLAYYKAPGYVAFVSAVPLTSTQKIQRGALKELIATTIGSEQCVDTRSLKKRPVQKAG